jgi:catechol 2,3-dioxygenase-like lactoylglutathione lyase family enzyme
MQLTFDQVHLGVPDPVAAAGWYQTYLGAAAGDHPDRVMFGPTRFIYLKNEQPVPSRDAAIDHVALTVADLTARVAALNGSGARVTTRPHDRDGRRACMIEDPWGASIELVEGDASRFDHVHLRVPNPERTAQWYVDHFGGTAGTFKGALGGVCCGDVWLVIEQGAAEPSAGHTIDHIGYRMPDLTVAAADLKGKGVAFTKEPHAGPPGAHAPVLMSFLEDPWGVKIELLQRRGE